MSNLNLKWSLQKYNSSRQEEWDNFVDNEAINSTFLHSRRFLNHNDLNNLDDCSFMFFKKGRLNACMPAVLITTEYGRIWNSHMRSTYGGLIISEKVGLEDVLEIVNLIESTFISLRVDEAIIRNTFRIFNRKFCDEFDYVLWKFGFKLKSREVEVGLDLKNKTYEQILKNYENGNKYNIKKALNHVHVNFSEDYKMFWNLLERNLSQRHNLKPTHNYKEIIKLKSLLKDGEIKLVAAYKDGEMIGGMVLFDFMNKYIHAQYIASSYEYQNIRPINAIIDYSIEWACKSNYEYFNLGTPNENNGNKINLGLSYFKEGFGGRSCLRETMHKVYSHE
jgi:hypothetical protein